MRVIYLSIIIYLIPTIGIAQEFALTDLSKLIFSDYDYFETVALNYGFKFEKIQNEENEESEKVKTYYYSKVANGAEILAYQSTTYDLIPATFVSIIYTTTIAEKFIRMKEGIKRSGYKLIKTVETPNGNRIFNFYDNPEINVSITTIIEGGNLNSYELRFSFRPLQEFTEDPK